MTGYLTSLKNPHFSGLATVVFRSSKRVTKSTKFTTTYIEAGFGVRQLVAALCDGDRVRYGMLPQELGEVKLDYALDEFGMLASFSIHGQED